MLITEYRFALPVTVEDYRRAQLFMVAKASLKETENGEGVEVMENREEVGRGHYTHKIIHIGSKVPGWLRFLLPSSALQVHEKAWNDYPNRCETVYSCPFLGEKFSVSITSTYVGDKGQLDNATKMSEEDLKIRTVEFVDIASPVPPEKYDASEDPCIYKAKKCDMGPYPLGWVKTTANPVMTCYKAVRVTFSYWGLQGRIEQFIMGAVLDVLVRGHRQAVCWSDEWWDKSMEDIRAMEEEVAIILKQKIHGNAEQAAPQPQ